MKIHLECLILALSLCTYFVQVQSNWWSFAMVQPKTFRSPRQTRRVCQRLPGLTRLQRNACRQHPDFMVAVSKGARLAVKSCERMFVNHRWNCSVVERSPNIFGKLIRKSHRETALLYALFSAGLVHSVTKACSSGLIFNCHCNNRRRSSVWSSSSDWTGCNDDLRDGVGFSRLFLDTSESANKNPRNLMNVHNIEVGRKVVMGLMKKECKCHGVSGSCAMQTCRRRLKSFRVAAKILKRKYDSARMISPSRKEFSGKKVFPRGIKRSVKNDLVYFQYSPDYCSPDSKLDILGTGRRSCHPSDVALDSCDVICCGRGYDTFVRMIDYRCQCKFNWCCNVTCKTCKSIYEEYTCKE